MRGNRPDWRDYAWFAFAMGLIVAIGFLVFILSRWAPTEATTWAFWSGNGEITPLGFVGSIFTGIVAVASILVLFWRTWINDQEHKAQLKVALAERFRSGSELLASTEPVVNASGIIVLRELAAEEPQAYGSIVSTLLLAYVNLKGHAGFEEIDAWVNRPDDEEEMPSLDQAPIYMNALRALGDLRAKVPAIWSATERKTTQESLRETALVGLVEKSDFSSLRFSKVAFTGSFSRCNFSRAHFAFCLFANPAFRHCDLRGAELSFVRRRYHSYMRIYSSNLQRVLFSSEGLSLEVSQSDLTDATIRAVAIEGWVCYAERRPLILAKNWDPEQAFIVYDSTGPGTWWTDSSGIRQFRPDDGCPYWQFDASNATWTLDEEIPF